MVETILTLMVAGIGAVLVFFIVTLVMDMVRKSKKLK